MTAPLGIEVAAAMRGKEIAAESLATTTKGGGTKRWNSSKERNRCSHIGVYGLSVCRVHDREEHEGGSDTKLRLLRNKFI
jgi:hypothetical protein